MFVVSRATRHGRAWRAVRPLYDCFHILAPNFSSSQRLRASTPRAISQLAAVSVSRHMNELQAVVLLIELIALLRVLAITARPAYRSPEALFHAFLRTLFQQHWYHEETGT